MTAEFNISIPGAEIIKRLVDLESQNVALTARLAAVEELPFIPRTVATVSYVDNQLEVLSRHLRHYVDERHQALTDRVESTAREVTAFTGAINVLITATDRFHDRIEQLEDAMNWTDGANMENATAPVDTSWHPYDVAANTPGFQAPWGRDRRVVVLTRYDNIEGPAKADTFDWGECGGGTIVAWRYAKAGE